MNTLGLMCNRFNNSSPALNPLDQLDLMVAKVVPNQPRERNARKGLTNRGGLRTRGVDVCFIYPTLSLSHSQTLLSNSQEAVRSSPSSRTRSPKNVAQY